MKVFDMGRNIRFDGFPDLLTIKQKDYVQGRVDQFALDLFSTGRATMPNGEVVNLNDGAISCCMKVTKGA